TAHFTLPAERVVLLDGAAAAEGRVLLDLIDEQRIDGFRVSHGEPDQLRFTIGVVEAVSRPIDDRAAGAHRRDGEAGLAQRGGFRSPAVHAPYPNFYRSSAGMHGEPFPGVAIHGPAGPSRVHDQVMSLDPRAQRDLPQVFAGQRNEANARW